MWNYLIQNKEWVFSGIGVFILSLVVAYFSNKKRMNKGSQNGNQFSSNAFDNSSLNNFMGDKLNFSQTIVHNIKEKDTAKEQSLPIIATPELAKARQNYLSVKTKLRANIYTVLAKSKAQSKDTAVEIRHILDEVEELIDASHMDTLSELKEMKEEGLIEFPSKDEESFSSPYTRIMTTSKFYNTIKDISE